MKNREEFNSTGYYRVSYKYSGSDFYWEGAAEDEEEAYDKALLEAKSTLFFINEKPEPWEVFNLKIKHVKAPTYEMMGFWKFVAGFSIVLGIISFILGGIK